MTGTAQPISVGIVVSQTGRLSAVGQAFINGFEMAREEVEAQRDGTGLTFIIEDDQSTIEGGKAAYNKLIHEDGVPAILGVFSSTIVREVFPIAQENGVVAISPHFICTRPQRDWRFCLSRQPYG